MATLTSPLSWPPDPPVVDGLTAGISKSSTLVQFAVGACMVFVQHLVQSLIGFGGLEIGRALLIGNLVPALEGLLTAFGGMRLGIGSAPPILLLDPSRRGDLPVLDPLVSPGFDLTRGATEGVSPSDFDLGEETAFGMSFASGCMVLAMLAGAWIVRIRISMAKVRTNAGTTVSGSPLIPSKNFCPTAAEVSSTETGRVDPSRKDEARTRRRGDPGHRHSDPRGDEANRANDSDDDSDDDDPSPPPPGPGTGLHHDDDRMCEKIGWKHLAVLGYLVGTMLKGLKKLKTKAEVSEQTGGANYGKEWDVLEGTYAFSRSTSNVGISSWPKNVANDTRITNSPTKLATNFRLIAGVVSFNEAITSFLAGIPSAMRYAGRNQIIPAVFSDHNSTWAGIKATVKKAWANVDLTLSMIYLRICLEEFLETFGLVDFAELVVLPLIIAVLRDRNGELDDAEDGGSEEQHLLDHEPLSEDNKASKVTESRQRDPQSRPKWEGDEEDFLYLNQRVSASPNIPNGNNSAQINVSTSPNRSIERCATRYSELAEFIVRHDPCTPKDVVELTLDTSRTLIEDYADETVTELTSFRSGDIGGELHATETGRDSPGENFDLDTGRGSRAGGGCEDAQELPDDLSDVESYATAEGSDVEEPNMPEEKPEDEDDGDPTHLLPGGFSVLWQVPVWGARSNRWPIFSQFEELREGEPPCI